MKFLKDFFYLNYHERRALLAILFPLVVCTTLVFIVGSIDTTPSEKQRAQTTVSSDMPQGNIQAITKTEFRQSKHSPLIPTPQVKTISNGWDWKHGKPETS